MLSLRSSITEIPGHPPKTVFRPKAKQPNRTPPAMPKQTGATSTQTNTGNINPATPIHTCIVATQNNQPPGANLRQNQQQGATQTTGSTNNNGPCRRTGRPIPRPRVDQTRGRGRGRGQQHGGTYPTSAANPTTHGGHHKLSPLRGHRGRGGHREGNRERGRAGGS